MATKFGGKNPLAKYNTLLVSKLIGTQLGSTRGQIAYKWMKVTKLDM